jgi:hypothetical protein
MYSFLALGPIRCVYARSIQVLHCIALASGTFVCPRQKMRGRPLATQFERKSAAKAPTSALSSECCVSIALRRRPTITTVYISLINQLSSLVILERHGLEK